MKQVLDARRHPHAAARRARTTAPRCARPPSASASRSIVKPIAGAGSADTYRVRRPRRARARCCPRSRHVARGQRRGVHRGRGVHVRHDLRRAARSSSTTSAGTGRGRWSRGTLEWISPQTIALRDLDAPHLAAGVRDGARRCSRRSASATGFTHMEWYLQGRRRGRVRRDRRPAAGRAHRRHHELRLRHRPLPRLGRGRRATAASTQPIERTLQRRDRSSSARRAQGRIQRIEGLERAAGASSARTSSRVDLLPDRRAAPRLEADADLRRLGRSCATPTSATTIEIADRVGTDLQLYAG